MPFVWVNFCLGMQEAAKGAVADDSVRRWCLCSTLDPTARRLLLDSWALTPCVPTAESGTGCVVRDGWQALSLAKHVSLRCAPALRRLPAVLTDSRTLCVLALFHVFFRFVSALEFFSLLAVGFLAHLPMRLATNQRADNRIAPKERERRDVKDDRLCLRSPQNPRLVSWCLQ